MLDLKLLEGLKSKIEAHIPDWTKFTAKEVRKYKEQYRQDKTTLITKVGLIGDYTERIKKYEDDIVELLARFKKMGFIFLEEETPKRTSPVLEDPPPVTKPGPDGDKSQDPPPPEETPPPSEKENTASDNTGKLGAF